MDFDEKPKSTKEDEEQKGWRSWDLAQLLELGVSVEEAMAFGFAWIVVSGRRQSGSFVLRKREGESGGECDWVWGNTERKNGYK